MPPPETMHTQQKIVESGPELEFHMENLEIRAEISEFRAKIPEIATNVATLAVAWSQLSPSRARDPPSNVTSRRPLANKGEPVAGGALYKAGEFFRPPDTTWGPPLTRWGRRQKNSAWPSMYAAATCITSPPECRRSPLCLTCGSYSLGGKTTIARGNTGIILPPEYSQYSIIFTKKSNMQYINNGLSKYVILCIFPIFLLSKINYSLD